MTDLARIQASYRLQLARIQNIATNGRLFCVMIFAVALAAFCYTPGGAFARMAILAAVPVGLSCIVDLLPRGKLSMIAAILVYLYTAAVACLLFLLLQYAG